MVLNTKTKNKRIIKSKSKQMLPFRNQVIPMEVNERTALDIVLERVEGYLRQDLKNPNLALEIEGKLGTFKLKKESQRELFSLLDQFSKQNFILLDDKDTHNHNNPTDNWIKLEKNFESGVDQKLFNNILDYFRRLYAFSKNYLPENFDPEFNKEYFSQLNRETKENITVDYVLGTIGDNKKQRLSYELGTGLYYLEKVNKIHFDLLHHSRKSQ